MRKKVRKAAIVLVFCLIVLMNGCGVRKDEPSAPVFSDRFNLANAYQINAGCDYGTDNGIVYRLGRQKALFWAFGEERLTAYDKSEFSTVDIQPEIDWDKTYRIGFSNGWYYYWRFNKDLMTEGLSSEYTLCALSLSDRTEEELMTFSREDLSKTIAFFKEDGVLYVADSTRDGWYFPIMKGNVEDAVSITDSYRMGNKEYVVKHKSWDAASADLVVLEDGEEHPVELAAAFERYLIPTEEGLLIWNQGIEHLLYLILPTGEIKELFSIPCMSSDSAVNVYGSDVFISVERYEKWGPGGISLQHYANDSLQGSYRISLKTGEVQKLSDNIYSGLFIFGDSGIIGCDKLSGKTFFMDFNFNILYTT